MNKTLLRILVLAKQVNKWVATKHLIEAPLQRSILLSCDTDSILVSTIVKTLVSA